MTTGVSQIIIGILVCALLCGCAHRSDMSREEAAGIVAVVKALDE